MRDEQLRVLISALVLSGLSTKMQLKSGKTYSKLAAEMAVERADALLEELNKDRSK